MTLGVAFLFWVVVYSAIHATHVYHQHRTAGESEDVAFGDAVASGMEYGVVLYIVCVLVLAASMVILYNLGTFS